MTIKYETAANSNRKVISNVQLRCESSAHVHQRWLLMRRYRQSEKLTREEQWPELEITKEHRRREKSTCELGTGEQGRGLGCNRDRPGVMK